MSDHNIAISVTGVSKSYTILHESQKHTTAAEALAHSLKTIGKKQTSETFWALKDVSFDINKGDVVGIIGRNGAGKSTLLKILSRITEPTSGKIDLYGRIGSLLEVGTGFHPELTGRENVFLNGAVLGMSRREIASHFDAIVDFAGVEKFLDTPVKRYSSGMYVRLAFAVAAHLEPEILIVDEVLAVGDAEFQKKCLGKMQDVAAHGRTVLFVSHNLEAVRKLCHTGLLMQNGTLALCSDIESVANAYMSDLTTQDGSVVWDAQSAPRTEEVRLLGASIVNDAGECTAFLNCRKPFSIVIEYEVLEQVKGLRIGFGMQSVHGVTLCGSNDPEAWLEPERPPGRYISRVTFPGYTLNAGYFMVNFGVDAPPFYHAMIDTPFCLGFHVEDLEGHGPLHQSLPGVMRPKLEWQVQHLGAG